MIIKTVKVSRQNFFNQLKALLIKYFDEKYFREVSLNCAYSDYLVLGKPGDYKIKLVVYSGAETVEDDRSMVSELLDVEGKKLVVVTSLKDFYAVKCPYCNFRQWSQLPEITNPCGYCSGAEWEEFFRSQGVEYDVEYVN